MAIINKQPVTLGEVQAIVKESEGKEQLKEYLKRFTKLPRDKANELKQEVLDIGNLKIKSEHAVKIADFVPRIREELNKVFTDVSLSEEETNAILEITKKY